MPYRLDLSSVVARAATIDERLAGLCAPANGDDEEVARVLAAWCESSAGGDEGRFGERLARDGHSRESVGRLLAATELAPGEPLPEWASDLPWILASLAAVGEGSSVDADDPLPFEPLFLSLVEDAGRRCELVAPELRLLFAGAARAQLGRHLLRRLTALHAEILYREFFAFRFRREPDWLHFDLFLGSEDGTGRFVAFLHDLQTRRLHELYRERPALLRLTAILTRQWMEGVVEMAQRLAADLPDVAVRFFGGHSPGQVTKVDPGLSDAHLGGRTVSLLQFASGDRLVHKPRQCDLAEAWHQLLGWLRRNRAPVDLRAAAVLPRSGYSWWEHVEFLPCQSASEAKAFMGRAGATLALLYLFQGVDVHYVNLLANVAFPVVVDLESLLHPRLRHPYAAFRAAAAFAVASDSFSDSVLATHLLPQYRARRARPSKHLRQPNRRPWRPRRERRGDPWLHSGRGYGADAGTP